MAYTPQVTLLQYKPSSSLYSTLSQTKCPHFALSNAIPALPPEAALCPQGAWCTRSKSISQNWAVPISLESVLLHHEFLEDRDHMATPVLGTGNNSELILLVHYDQLKQAYNGLLPSKFWVILFHIYTMTFLCSPLQLFQH